MIGPNAELQAALIQFSTQPGVSTDQAAQLRSAIVTNASLLTRLNQDAHAGHLKRLCTAATRWRCKFGRHLRFTNGRNDSA
jgi:hypothetical protein